MSGFGGRVRPDARRGWLDLAIETGPKTTDACGVSVPSVDADTDPVAWIVHAAAERLAGREPPLIPLPRASVEVEAPQDAESAESVDLPSLYRELRMLGIDEDELG